MYADHDKDSFKNVKCKMLIYFMFGILGFHCKVFAYFVPLSKIKEISPGVRNCSNSLFEGLYIFFILFFFQVGFFTWFNSTGSCLLFLSLLSRKLFWQPLYGKGEV